MLVASAAPGTWGFRCPLSVSQQQRAGNTGARILAWARFARSRTADALLLPAARQLADGGVEQSFA